MVLPEGDVSDVIHTLDRYAQRTKSGEVAHFRLTREFSTSTMEEERVRFLDVLFAVADADGHVSHEEIEEIRRIAKSLNLTHKQFIGAKLKIPRERRAN